MSEALVAFSGGTCVVEWAAPIAKSESPIYRAAIGEWDLQIFADEKLGVRCKAADDKRRRVDLLVKRGDEILLNDFCIFDGTGQTMEAPLGSDSSAPVTVTFHEPLEPGVWQSDACNVQDSKPLSGSEGEIASFEWETQIEHGKASGIYDVLGFKVLLRLALEASGEYGLHCAFLDVGREKLISACTCEIVNFFDETASYRIPARSFLLEESLHEIAVGQVHIQPVLLTNPNAGFVGLDGRAKLKLVMKARKPARPKPVQVKPPVAAREPEWVVCRSDVIPKDTIIATHNAFVNVIKIPTAELQSSTVSTSEYTCEGLSYKCTFSLAENRATFDFGFEGEKVFVYLEFMFVGNKSESVKRYMRVTCTKAEHIVTTTLPVSASELMNPQWVSDGCYLVYVTVKHRLRSFVSPVVVAVAPVDSKYAIKWEIPAENLVHPVLISQPFGIDSMHVTFRLLQRYGRATLVMVFKHTMPDWFVGVNVKAGPFAFTDTVVMTKDEPRSCYTLVDGKADGKLEDAVHDGVLTLAVTILYERPRHKGFLKPKAQQKAELEKEVVTNTATGYVGLLNQGATCYMNSILQALFHLPAFRKVVYNIETTGLEDPEKSIPLNLQRLFCNMQLSDRACSTQNVTRSFGWGSAETFVQHDVQEFLRVLMDNLENKLKDTPLQDAIPDIFRGKMRNYVRCVNVDYESSRVEDFMDLAMDVKGCRTLYESFKRYTTPERLEGDNQYSTDDYGKQDAVMGVELYRLPPVLHLQLRRFQYDWQTDRISKVVDRFEFPTELDLTEFLAKDSPDLDKSNIFDLYGVLVHSGGTYGGHYYAYLRTSTDPQWYLFNDSRVSFASMEDAVARNYGADEAPRQSHSLSKELSDYKRAVHYDMEKKHQMTDDSVEKVKKCATKGNVVGSTQFSGYMLVYIRREDAPRIMERIPDEAVPQHLKDYMMQGQHEEPVTYTYTTRSSTETKISLKYTLEDALPALSASGCTSETSPEACHTMEVAVATTLSELYELMRKESSSPSIRLWTMDYSNKLSKVIPCSDETVSSFCRQKSLSVFVQNVPEGESISVDADELIVFTRFFFPQASAPLQYIMAVRTKRDATVGEIGLAVKCRLGFPESTQLKAFAIGYSVQEVGLSEKVGAGWMGRTSIVFECAPGTDVPPITTDFVLQEPPTSKHDQEEADDVPSYRVTKGSDVSFRGFCEKNKMCTLNIYNIDDQNKLLFRLTLPDSTTLTDLKAELPRLAHIDFNPDTQEVVLCKEGTGQWASVSLVDEKTWKVVKTAFTQAEGSKVLFGITTKGSEKALVQVQLSLDGHTIDSQTLNIIPKTITCQDLIEMVMAKKGLEGNFRALFIRDHAITSIGKGSISQVYSWYAQTVRVERIPDDQLNVDPETERISACQFAVYTGEAFRMYQPMAEPFLFLFKKGEKFSETKTRLLPYMSITDIEQMKNFAFKVKIGAYSSDYKTVKDDSCVYDIMAKDDYQFVIISGAVAGACRAKRRQASQSVTIYN